MHPSTAGDAPPRVPLRPQLKPWYRLVETPDALVVEHAQSALVFEGAAARRLLPSLLPLLDGTRTVDDVVGRLGPETRPGVERALGLLAERRLLLDGPRLRDAGRPGTVETIELLASLDAGATLDGVAAALAEARVEVLGSGDVAAALVEVLLASGVGGVERGEGFEARGRTDDLAVVVPGRDEAAQVEAWNRRALAVGRVWLQVLPFDGRFAAIGPLYVPGETCCFECYRLRRRATSGYAEEFAAVESAPVAAPAGPALGAAVAALAATVVLRWLAHRDQRLPGVFHAYERGGLSLTEHRVYRVPRCPACSPGADVAPPLPWYKETRPAVAREAAG